MNKEKLLDVYIVAKRLGLHPEVIRRKIRMGYIQAINTSGGSRPTYRIKESEYLRYLEENKVE